MMEPEAVEATLAVAELVPGDVTVAPPRLNAVSLGLLDDAVDRIELAAQLYVCESAEDYQQGARDQAKSRSLIKLFEQSLTPIVQWWNARTAEAREELTKRTNRIETANKLRATKMLNWKAAEDKRTAERQAAEAALQKKRAEDLRLQQALEATERAKETGNTKLADAALKSLDRPLEVAPTQVASSVPKLTGTGVKTVKRKVVVAKKRYAEIKKQADAENRIMTDAEWRNAENIQSTDLQDLLICIGATLMLERPDIFPAQPNGDLIRAFLAQYASPQVADAGIIKGLDATWIKQKFAKFGDAFKLGGVEVVLKEGLG